MNTKTTSHGGPGVGRFLAAHGADVTGVISGYDRLRWRGSLRHLYQPTFMFRYLWSAGVRLKDFAGFLSGLTNRVCAASRRCQRGGAGRVTRLLGLLRAHGVIRNVTGAHRYIVTPKGRETSHAK